MINNNSTAIQKLSDKIKMIAIIYSILVGLLLIANVVAYFQPVVNNYEYFDFDIQMKRNGRYLGYGIPMIASGLAALTIFDKLLIIKKNPLKTFHNEIMAIIVGVLDLAWAFKFKEWTNLNSAEYIYMLRNNGTGMGVKLYAICGWLLIISTVAYIVIRCIDKKQRNCKSV
jgi:hypothetical protein